MIIHIKRRKNREKCEKEPKMIHRRRKLLLFSLAVENTLREKRLIQGNKYKMNV